MMLSSTTTNPAQALPGGEPLPENIALEIEDLAWKAARFSRPVDQVAEIVLTVRRRPLDRFGRTGCWVVIYGQGPCPPRGLHAILAAGGGNPWSDPRKSTRLLTGPRTFTLDRVLSGGWKLTLDARWHPARSGQKSGWST